MPILTGYTIVDEIFRSSGTTVYRARATTDNRAVVIKLLNREFPTHEEAAKIKREFEIARLLNLEGTVRPLALFPYQKSYALVLEDFGGVSLGSIMERRRLTLLESLAIGVTLANTLGKMHQRGVIHKDVKPPNIIVNETTGQVKLTDFRISSVIGSEHQELVNPDRLEGTFPYIAPEQTGRMNRSIDTRADLYSLGVTLYEMLTGRLPFMAKDPLEFIHCHIAVSPVPPQEVNPEIPDPLGAIVLRLLAKNAEDRYRSGFGLKHDLEHCLSRLRDTGRLESFPMASRDIPSFLQIPEKLYGRDQEFAQLLAAFNRIVAGDSRLLLVTGSPGIGKSTLVRELYRPVVASRAHFAAGKFGQYQGDIPYSALVTAFGGLLRQILSEPAPRLAAWRDELAAALGANAGIIIDLVPELELLLGPQPPVIPLPPAESQNRFNLAVSRFVKTLAGKEHPLVLFLDDLQWADAATVHFLGLIASNREIRGLLFIGAFRDGEVGPSHPLSLGLDRLSRDGVLIERLQITALSTEGVVALITETFLCPPAEA